jgi:hypothetical protein
LHFTVVFEPGGSGEHEKENDDEPLFRLGKDEHIEKPLHDLA